jgi:6-phosphogluconate dehydrogenase
MDKYNVAMIGLGVMGANLLLNLERNGFSGVGFDINAESTKKFLAGVGKGKNVTGAADFKEVAAKLERPRKIFILVPAGKPVDSVLGELSKVLEKGDIVVECGNSHYPDTNRRESEMSKQGFHFTGMGVSGGEEGALKGPSLMPGGPKDAYERLRPSLEKIAAQVEDGACVTWCGPAGAGHYTKMVHNGIEYGDMQLIAEAYDVLKRMGGLSNAELADTFDEWNRGELESFLIEITARIFRKKDDGGGEILDKIMDSASMKGTGKWTVEDATEMGVPIPTISAAVDARVISAMRDQRLAAAKILGAPAMPKPANDKKAFVEAVRCALYCAKTVSYAQGYAMLREAASQYQWTIPLGDVARIWKGGCIIRAKFLRSIQEAYKRDANLTNLLVDPFFKEAIAGKLAQWRRVVVEGIQAGIPLPATSASLAYYDAYRTERLPANLVQAQRDLFGAHTYQRLDKPGSFHTQW